MNLDGKVTNPGELNIWIELYKRDVTVQTGGFQTPSLVMLAGAWSKWVNVHGQEAWIASSVMAESPATVTIRYRDDLDTTCVAKKAGQFFEIVSIDDIVLWGLRLSGVSMHRLVAALRSICAASRPVESGGP